MFRDLDQFSRAALSSISFIDSLRLTTTILLFSIFFSIVLMKINKLRRLPPGPWGIPFLGSLPWMMAGAPHSWYNQLAQRYGNLTSVKLGSNLLVCIGSARLLRELFNRPDSIDRPHTPLNNLLGGRGIILSEGLLWKRQRQFIHEKFRALGVKLFNYERLEKYIMVEIKEFLSKLENSSSVPLDPVVHLGRHVHNVICQLMMSFRFEEHDPEFKAFNYGISKGMELFGSVHIGEHIPSYLYLPGKMAVMQEIGRRLRDVSEFHVRNIVARREQRAGSSLAEPADLLDYYLMEIEKETESSKLFDGVDPDEQIVQVMNDLFSAGMETSRSALAWTLVMMVREPAVAARVRSELQQILEPGDLVSLKHRPRLPYLEAVIFETMRLVSVVPLGTTHVNSNRWIVGGYEIPAGTHLVPLLNKINMDPESFPDPHQFTPERFLKNGQLHIPDTFTAFGVGRRVCLGEQLARIELFLFFANLMNSFEFCLPKDQRIPKLEGVMFTTHAPLPYKLCFKKIVQDSRVTPHG